MLPAVFLLLDPCHEMQSSFAIDRSFLRASSEAAKANVVVVEADLLPEAGM